MVTKARREMNKLLHLACAISFVILLNSCAFDIVLIKQLPSQIEIIHPSKNSFRLEEEITVDLDTGYGRTLRRGTTWDYVGSIREGDVFKTSDQILTIEASNIFEAYIVVSAENLVGFYLPVEKTYSPLDKSRQLVSTKIPPSQ